MTQKPTYAELVQKVKDLKHMLRKRKRMEETLKNSVANLSLAQEAAHIGSWDWDLPTDTLHWSDELYRLYGLQPGSCEITFKHAWDPIHPDDKEHVGIALEAARDHGTSYEIEFRITRPDGEERIVKGIGRAVKDETGKVIRIYGTGQDITEQKKAQEALQKSVEKYRSLTNNLNVGVYRNTIGPKGTTIEANPAIFKMFGYDTREEYLDVHISDLYKDPNERKEYSARIVRDGFVKNEEIQLRKKNGTSLIGSVSAVAVKDEKGEVKYTDGIIEDITERKQAEEALRESEEKYRILVENADDAILIVQDETIKFANSKTEELAGYSAEELWKIPFANLIHPDDRAMVSERHKRRLVEKELPSTYSFRIINKTGEELWMQLNSVLVNWEGFPAALNFLRDITQQKKLEAQLVIAQRMEALGTLAGGIAHDFNNLLMGIQGNASLMLIEKDSGDPDYDKLKNIEQYIQNGADLTRQLLGFARGGKYDAKPTNINDIIKKSSQMFGRTRKEIKIHRKYQKDVWTVEVDRGQVEQVLLNFYVNTWQAMPGGGELFLETENATLDENDVKPFAVDPGNYVKISITDTGVGMDEATQQRIFEPFFTTKEMGRGTGLGLAAAYGIIKNHGGFIYVYSEKGEGATFIIYLPASETEVIEDKKPLKAVVKGEGTILLVDDEEMIIDVAKQLLEKLGYMVLVARSGKEAISVYGKNRARIDLIILDMIMPDMSGGNTYDRLKEINPDIKVLLSSGYSISGQAQEILDRGCNGFIQKPFTMKTLSQKIRETLDKG